MSARLVLGLDVGGTSTRALAVDAAAGERLGAGRAGGANPVAHGVVRAAENIGTAVAEALTGHDPAEVKACVVGLAGESKVATDPGAAAAFAALWQAVGLRCEVAVISDVAAAFAAGTAASDGSVLISGTGAVAAGFTGRRLTGWRDGHGWLLGDDGSGFWIGRQAVRAALSALDGSGPHTALLEAALAAYLDPLPSPPVAAGSDESRHVASALITAVNERPPVDLAILAPEVLARASAQDRVAQGILVEASAFLIAALCQVREPAEVSPIVLAGGLLRPGTAVDLLVRAELAATWPDAPVHAATDGAAGAAWLAALQVFGDAGESDRARALHAQLTAEEGTGNART